MPVIQVTPLPIDRVIVDRIDAISTDALGGTSYTITASVVGDHRRVQYKTISDLDASACDRSLKWRLPLLIRWKQTADGKDITRVQIERRR